MQPRTEAKLEAKIVARPAFTVVGMTYRGDNKHNEIPQLWSEFGPRMHEVQHVLNPDVSYGVMDNYDPKTGEFDYMAAFEVRSTSGIAEGMDAKIVPAQTYAVFACTLVTIGQTYSAINEQWLPKSGYRRADGPDFELYDEHFTPGDPNSVMFIYLPIEPK